MRFNEERKKLWTLRRIFAIVKVRFAFFFVVIPNQIYAMKKLFSFLAIIGIILASNCSRIPENNNPVIGIWSDVQVKAATDTQKKQILRQEWIFNDAYLGRYHEKTNGSITFKTDFRWSYDNDIYTITYPGTDMEEKTVSMAQDEDAEILSDAGGNVMAIRE